MIRSLLLLLAACGAPAASTAIANSSDRPAAHRPLAVTIPPYGDVALEDGSIQLMDHNNGDQRVHIMNITRDFHGTATSWDDRPGVPTEMRRGTFPIDDDERAYIRTFSERIWRLAPTGRRTLPRAPGTNGYEWAVVMRRGDEVRAIDGGTISDEEDSNAIDEAVDFLDMHF